MASRFTQSKFPYILFGLLLVVILFLVFKNNNFTNYQVIVSSGSQKKADELTAESNVKIGLVSCGNERAVEVVTLIKSALIFASRTIEFYIITEKENIPKFIEQFDRWPEAVRNKFTYQFTEPYFPSNDSIDWKPIFKTCATQRLFLPEIFNTIDSMLYLDADILFFYDVVELWDELKRFNQKQIIAFAPDFYSNKQVLNRPPAKIPFYGKLGFNSGVMLMNMTRLREFNMHEKMVPIYQKYHTGVVNGDQCLLNALFYENPERVYDLDCAWNFYFTYCEQIYTCPSADIRGVKILHGLASRFKYTEMKVIHDAFVKYDFNRFTNELYENIQYAFVAFSSSNCARLKSAFLKNLDILKIS